jgi:hypothetical protein
LPRLRYLSVSTNSEGRQGLASARIVEVIPGERRAPVFEDADQAPLGHET